MHFGQKIILSPLNPNDVREDQKKMKYHAELNHCDMGWAYHAAHFI